MASTLDATTAWRDGAPSAADRRCLVEVVDYLAHNGLKHEARARRALSLAAALADPSSTSRARVPVGAHEPAHRSGGWVRETHIARARAQFRDTDAAPLRAQLTVDAAIAAPESSRQRGNRAERQGDRGARSRGARPVQRSPRAAAESVAQGPVRGRAERDPRSGGARARARRARARGLRDAPEHGRGARGPRVHQAQSDRAGGRARRASRGLAAPRVRRVSAPGRRGPTRATTTSRSRPVPIRARSPAVSEHARASARGGLPKS